MVVGCAKDIFKRLPLKNIESGGIGGFYLYFMLRKNM
jgi:hypothetical protein